MPTKFTWTDPTTNTDGSAITSSEIAGYQVGIRPAGGAAGTYPILSPVTSPGATEEAISAIGTVLQPGTYVAAVKTVAVAPAIDSAWSAEVQFTIAAPQPNPPSNFGVA